MMVAGGSVSIWGLKGGLKWRRAPGGAAVVAGPPPSFVPQKIGDSRVGVENFERLRHGHACEWRFGTHIWLRRTLAYRGVHLVYAEAGVEVGERRDGRSDLATLISFRSIQLLVPRGSHPSCRQCSLRIHHSAVIRVVNLDRVSF